MLRAGLITYGLDRPLSGISRYTLELARTFEGMRDQVEIILLTAGHPGPLSNTSLEKIPLPGCERLPGLLTLGHLLLPVLAKRCRLDVIHDPTAVTPLLFGAGNNTAVVSTVHDVFPLSYPGHNSRLDNWIYRYWLPYQLPRIDHVITDSEQSKRDIQTFLKVPGERITTIMLGVRDIFKPTDLQEARALLRARYGLEHSYILFVGNFTTRKNIALALRGFAAIHRDFPDLRFVLVGPRTFAQTPVAALIAELGIEDKVITTGPVEDAMLPLFYTAARVFVFPSFYEGFGLPVLEAMACGTPVITSKTSSLPEVAGEAALLIDPQSIQDITNALQKILTDDILHSEFRKRGFERAAAFTWEQTARKTISVYQDAVTSRL